MKCDHACPASWKSIKHPSLDVSEGCKFKPEFCDPKELSTIYNAKVKHVNGTPEEPQSAHVTCNKFRVLAFKTDLVKVDGVGQKATILTCTDRKGKGHWTLPTKEVVRPEDLTCVLGKPLSPIANGRFQAFVPNRMFG